MVRTCVVKLLPFGMFPFELFRPGVVRSGGYVCLASVCTSKSWTCDGIYASRPRARLRPSARAAFFVVSPPLWYLGLGLAFASKPWTSERI